MTTLTLYQQPDYQLLGTIAGVDYYEVRQILRDDGDTRLIVGNASDWPIISRDARISELEQRINELEAAARTPYVAAMTIPHASDDGKVACDWPGCTARVKPRGILIHKRRAHGGVLLLDASAIEPPAPVIQLIDDDPTWRCAECSGDHNGPFTRSLHDPDRCIRCAQLTNGHNGHCIEVTP